MDGFFLRKMPPNRTVSYSLARSLLVFFSHLIFIFFSFGNWLLFWPSYTVTLSSCVLLLLVCSLRLLSFPNDCCLWCTHYDNKWFHIRFRLFCFILFGRLSETSLFESVSYQYHQSSSCCFHSVSLAHALSICEAQSLYFFGCLCIVLIVKKNTTKSPTTKKNCSHFLELFARYSWYYVNEEPSCVWSRLSLFCCTHNCSVRWECVERLFTTITITRWLFSTTTKIIDLFVESARNVLRWLVLLCIFVFIRAAIVLVCSVLLFWLLTVVLLTIDEMLCNGCKRNNTHSQAAYTHSHENQFIFVALVVGGGAAAAGD